MKTKVESSDASDLHEPPGTPTKTSSFTQNSFPYFRMGKKDCIQKRLKIVFRKNYTFHERL